MTPKNVLCCFLSFDFSEISDYRYHYGRTSAPVYAIDGKYYCCVKTGKKPPKHRDGMNWNWTLTSDSFTQGFSIYESE